jgi:predicted amidohydrolase
MQMEKNFAKAVEFIRAASDQGAHLAVLPEYHLLGWVPEDPGFKSACENSDIYLNRYCSLAKECNINIVPGTILELDTASTDHPQRLLNVAYFITNQGEIAGKYAKKNLWGAIERQHLTSSSREAHSVFDTPLGRVGILVCWDLGFPEGFRELIAQGAQLIVAPAFWLLSDTSKAGLDVNPLSDQLFINSLLTTRCFENTCGKSHRRAMSF